MPETAVKPPPVEIKQSEGLAPKPVERPKQPLGQTEQNMVEEIQTVTTQPNGNPDQVLQDIAGEQTPKPQQAAQQTPRPEDQINQSPPREQKSRTPQFIKEFSKTQSAEERQQLARDIKDTRKEHFEQKKEVEEQQTQLQQEAVKKELTLTEQRQKLEALHDEVARLSGPWFSRLLNYTKLRGLNVDLQTSEEAYQRLQQDEVTLRVQEQAVGAEADKLKDAPKLEEGRQKLKSFYKNEKEKWAAAEYTKEDIAKYFTEEHLASLSTEDYALLLKRFPSEMVTHVTRQGIRDHVGGDFHTAGLGEYFDNFRQIIQDGRLKSQFGALFQNGLTKEAIAQALELGGTIKTREDAEAYLGQFMAIGGAGSYADRTAFHVAAGEVADGIYGGEQGNEIFFTFPSAHIAAEHYFSGLSETSVGSPHNDKWIWTKDQKGLGINAGMVFIPSDAKVDPKTGSKYELSSDKKPVEYKDRIDAVIQYINSDKFEEISQEIYHLGGLSSQEQALQILQLQQRLNTQFGISDPKVQEGLLNYSNNLNLNKSHSREKLQFDYEKEAYSPENIARSILQKTGALYKEAEVTVSSKDFWEGYFAQHSEQQPKRIVYYEEGDPTKALRSWKESNGITKKAEAADLGFPEKQITTDEDPRTVVGMDRFRNIAEEVIDDYFSSQPQAA